MKNKYENKFLVLIICIGLFINIKFCNDAKCQSFIQCHSQNPDSEFKNNYYRRFCYEIENDSIYKTYQGPTDRYAILENKDSSIIDRKLSSYDVYPRFFQMKMDTVFLKELIRTYIFEFDTIYNCVFNRDTIIEMKVLDNSADSLIFIPCFQVNFEAYFNVRSFNGKSYRRFKAMIIEKGTGIPLFYQEEICFEPEFINGLEKYFHETNYFVKASNYHPKYYQKYFLNCYSKEFYSFFNKGVVILNKKDFSRFFKCDSILNVELVKNISIVNNTLFEFLDEGEYVIFYKIGYGDFKLTPTFGFRKDSILFSSWNESRFTNYRKSD